MQRSNKRKTPQNQSETYWLYGLHPVRAALQNTRRIHHELVCTTNALARLEIPLPPSLSIRETKPKDIDKLVGQDAVHQGIALKTEPLEQPGLEDIQSGTLLVLDQVTDPHNVGAIMRSAAAFNAAAIISTARHSATESATLAKSASGAFEIVPMISVTNLSRAIEELQKSGYFCVGLDGEAKTILENVLETPRPVALVMGAEGKGLRQKTKETCNTLARLNLPGQLQSLNVSNAAILSLYITMQKTSKS
jgi:23S rRNA (guanosine2251-2'-O)-methyltransferase